MNDTEQMAMDVIDVLDANPEAEYTQAELLIAAGYDPERDKLTRRARRLVQEALAKTGFFVPPSIPSLGFRIFSTKNPDKLLEPLLHIGSIGHGIDKLMLRITHYMVNSAAGKEWSLSNPQAYWAIDAVHRSYSVAVENSDRMTTQIQNVIAARG